MRGTSARVRFEDNDTQWVDIATLVREEDTPSRPENRNQAPSHDGEDSLEGGLVIGSSRARGRSLRHRGEDDDDLPMYVLGAREDARATSIQSLPLSTDSDEGDDIQASEGSSTPSSLTPQPTTDQHAKIQDTSTMKRLLRQLLDLAATRLLQIIEHRQHALRQLPPGAPPPFAPRKPISDPASTAIT